MEIDGNDYPKKWMRSKTLGFGVASAGKAKLLEKDWAPLESSRV